MPKSYKECNREYIYYSDYILIPLVCRHKSKNKLLFKDFTGYVEHVMGRGKEEACIKPCVKFIKFRGDENQRD